MIAVSIFGMNHRDGPCGFSEKDYKEVIKFFYTYSKWFPSDAIDKIIETSYEDITESLQKFADDLRAGKDVDVDSGSKWTPPDGYAEAFDMFMMADELGAPELEMGEVGSSEGIFDIVIAKAEEGDSEAKFTAGKYFIADHIEEETERAIRWIREAAEAGVEEAEDYMNEHSELFE